MNKIEVSLIKRLLRISSWIFFSSVLELSHYYLSLTPLEQGREKKENEGKGKEKKAKRKKGRERSSNFSRKNFK